MTTLKNVVVIGGSGFIGQAVCNELARYGFNITVPTRRYSKAKHLLTLPTCHVVETNIHDRAALGKLMVGQDLVVNLLGVLHSKRGKPYGPAFRVNHVEFPKSLCAAMTKHGVKRIVHISALGVGVQNLAPSMYLRSKTDGEVAVKDSGLHWTILRPSVVFGKNDRFLNTFASLSKLTPFIPLACADTLFQPVSVGDIGKAVAECALDTTKTTIHNTYDLAGPEVFSLSDLVKLSARAIGKYPVLFPIPESLAKIQAFLMELAPGDTVMSRDNVDSMKVDNIRTAGKLFPLDHYESLSVVAPEYLKAKYLPSNLDQFRKGAHRES